MNYIAGQTGFYNYGSRSWTSLKAGTRDDLIQVDHFGIIYLVKLKISFEIWLYHETKVYTPGTYLQITRKFSADNGVITVNLGFGAGSLPLEIGPVFISDNQLTGIQIGCPRMLQPVLEHAVKNSTQSFEPIKVWLVVRPFGPNGLTKVSHLEFKDGYLMVNRKKVLHFREEPDYCFFTNAARGDVTQYFRLWEGNAKIEAMDGSCTGMVGFSAVPADWRTIKIGIYDEFTDRFRLKPNWFPGVAGVSSKNGRLTGLFLEIAGKLRTGTIIDELYSACIRHLITFCRKQPIDIYQIMVLNRLGLNTQSLAYLKTALKKVRWDGRLDEESLGGECVIFAVADYYKMTGDRSLIEKYWPVLKRVGSWLCYQSGLIGTRSKSKSPQGDDPVRLEKILWLCASLQAITGLGTVLAKNCEVQLFKNHFLMIWAKLLDGLSLNGNPAVPAEWSPGHEPEGETMLRVLMASYPLQLSERGATLTQGWLRRIWAHHLWQGGFFSPQNFQGVNLELTARLGQILIREGMEYRAVLNFLLEAAGPTFSWPDKINPLSKEGIGEEGHDPRVLYQMLLMIRSVLLMEESESLHLLPGLFISRFWQAPNLELTDWPTYFGTVSLKVHTIGGIIQINFKPSFRRRPEKILLTFGEEYRLLYTDTKIQWNDKTLILDPDFQVLRVFNNACLDNTFRDTL